MTKTLILLGIWAVVVATSVFALPATEVEIAEENKENKAAYVALNEDGSPQFVLVGDRRGLDQLTNIFNFTAYIQNAPANTTSMTVVPVITILASLFG